MGLTGKKILLTGATGFIGGYVANDLLESGAKLFCTIRKPAPKSNFYELGLHKKTQLVKCNLSDFKSVEKIFKQENFDFVVHMAGVLRPKNMKEAFLGNVAPTHNILTSSKNQKNLKGIILSSSSRSKLSDLDLSKIDSLAKKPYDFSKTLADAVTNVYLENKSLPVAVIKFPNVFGPGDDLVKPLRLTAKIMEDIKNGEPNNFVNKKDKIELAYVKDSANFIIEVLQNINKYKYKTKEFKPIVSTSVEKWAEIIRHVVKNKKPKNRIEKAILETYT